MTVNVSTTVWQVKAVSDSDPDHVILDGTFWDLESAVVFRKKGIELFGQEYYDWTIDCFDVFSTAQDGLQYLETMHQSWKESGML